VNGRVSIVALEGHTLDPGDSSWDSPTALGGLKVYARTSSHEQVIDRARNAQLGLANKTILTRDTTESLSDLTCIGVMATGCNVVDMDAVRGRSVPVTNVAATSHFAGGSKIKGSDNEDQEQWKYREENYDGDNGGGHSSFV